MERRNFLAGSAVGITSLTAASGEAAASVEKESAKTKNGPIRMHIGCQWGGLKNPHQMRQRYGVENVCMYHYDLRNPQKVSDEAQLREFRDKVESFDQSLDMLMMPLRFNPLPRRLTPPKSKCLSVRCFCKDPVVSGSVSAPGSTA